jgi:hypothetical protein
VKETTMSIDATNKISMMNPMTAPGATEPLAGLSIEDAVAVLQSRSRELATEIQKHAVALDGATITHDLASKVDGILSKRSLDGSDVEAARSAYDKAIGEAKQSADWDLVTKLTRAKETFESVIAKHAHFDQVKGNVLQHVFETDEEKASDPDFVMRVDLGDDDIEAIETPIGGHPEPRDVLHKLLGLLRQHDELVGTSKDWLARAMDRLG